MIIYEAKNIINGKRYIGQTIQELSVRRQQHLDSVKYNNSGCRLFKRALNKYGENNFIWKVIDTAISREELNLKESFWIEFFRTTDVDFGYNLKGGGYNPFLTDQVKQAIGDAQRGALNHSYGKFGADNSSSKAVMIVDTGEVFSAVSELCRKYTDYSVSRVCSACRGERYTYKGHIFRYLDAEGNILNNGLPTTFSEIHLLKHNNLSSVSKNKKRVLDVTNNVLYESVVDAVGKRYQRSLLRKLNDVDECDYHNIHWKLIH